MLRRWIILGLLLLLSCGGGGEGRHRHLLIITLDTVRRDAIGCYGAEAARTPNLDRLAREGVLFADAQVPVPITLPSHASLFTGLYPAFHGARHNGLRVGVDFPTLAELLGEKGYVTAAFLASQVLSGAYGLERGFEVYEDEWETEESEMGLHGLWERRAEGVTRSFLDWFAKRDPERPFFAWIHYYDPHSPYDPPEPFTLAAGGNGYAGEVAYVDNQVGRVMDAIRSAGILDETVVIALSDHGEGLGEHDESEHGLLLYETTLAVPWILRIPGGPIGEIDSSPVESTDLLPTLAELFSFRADRSWPGRSALSGGDGAGDPARVRYAETYYGAIGYGWSPLYAVREGGWKLVRGARSELFHLDPDPREEEDLFDAERGRAHRLEEELDRLIASQPAPKEDREEPALTEEQKAALLALGYTTPAHTANAEEGAPDPRDRFLAHEWILAGRNLAMEERTAEAAEIFLKALAVDPENVDALNRLAQCRHKLGEREDEERTYRRILEIDPDHAITWNNLGILTEMDGDREGALACYDRAVQIDSTFADAWVNRGILLVQDGAAEQAWRDFTRALRVDPGQAKAHYGKAMILHERGDLEGVIRELRLSLRADPAFVEARIWLRSIEQSRRGY
ncbi:MAG: tetratricopeptide repeat protein [Candidatus Eisenbacteria bacterium]|nr:tetratricopeptide repeat protein [Candidatus Eisenbacteria bacterium]